MKKTPEEMVAWAMGGEIDWTAVESEVGDQLKSEVWDQLKSSVWDDVEWAQVDHRHNQAVDNDDTEDLRCSFKCL